MVMLARSAPQVSEFDHAADLVLSLAELTAAARARLGITVTVQAQQIGIASTTLTRLEAGGEPMRSTIVSVLRWLAIN
jgi:DNA-binding phage protein